MNEQISRLLKEITRLEDELHDALQAQQAEIRYRIEGARVRFEHAVLKEHQQVKIGLLRWFRDSSVRNIVSAPFIYALVVPFILLDLGVTIYQAICFPLYRMPKVSRSRYILIDRHQLAYLNSVEKLNCVYCGYATGLLAYIREIAARTEQYWCPIKHARKVIAPHRRYARFLDFGEAADYQEHLERMRAALAEEKG